MVLEKLGSSLRETLGKLTKSLFVDERTIDELVKELQRGLLKADVNVQQVFKLTETIKSRALKEKAPSGMSQKEYIVKIVYDELVNLLGKEGYKIEINKKPFKIMLVGLFGSGKCVHGESKIVLSNGEITKIQDLYELTSKESDIQHLEDGEVININSKNLTVPSFNPKTAKIEHKRATHLWKLKKENLIEVKLDNGNDFSVKVTPEHPFFILREGVIKKARADELTTEDVISIPSNYTHYGQEVSILSELKNLNLDYYTEAEEAKKTILKKYGNLLRAYKNLKYKKNYCKFTLEIKRGRVPIEFLENNLNYLTVTSKQAQKNITIPTYLTKEFSEFLGYVIGDGNVDTKYISISNEDPEIIQRVTELSKLLFNITPKVTKDKRTKNMLRINLTSTTLVQIMGIFGLKPGKKGPNLKIPNQILRSTNETISPFIRAYFDCNSHPEEGRNIELVSESKIIIQQMNILLLRFGIASTISKKIIKYKSYSKLYIKAKYAERYASQIGYLITRKKERVSNYEKIGILQGCGKQDMIPLGNSLKTLRVALGFSIGEIQTKAVTNYGLYEVKGLISKENLLKLVDYYNLKGLGILYDFLSNIKSGTKINNVYSREVINGLTSSLIENGFVSRETNQILLTGKGQEFIQIVQSFNSQELLKSFENLAISDTCWSYVNEVNKIKNDQEFVYDLTIEDNHSFIANGIIVHNTTTAGKIAKFFQKRGYKTAAIQTDTWRPAAYTQLKTLGDQLSIPVFGDPKEKDPSKIYKKFEKELNKYDLILIDTAGRDALSKDLIDEIKKIGKLTTPNEVLLVLSADIGQVAEKQSQAFHDAVGVTGLVITKMDGTAKGGGALAGAGVTKAPVKFIGLGEKIDDLEPFDPTRFVSRILGMGDLETLLEKAREVVTEEKAQEISEKLIKGDFNLIDLYEQMSSMKKMGPLSKVLELIPGFGKINLPENMLEQQEEKLEKWKFIMQSMTKKELEDPEKYLDSSRIERIAKGSGTNTTEVRELLKQYKQSKKMMKMMKGENPEKLMKKFKGKIPGM
jgi:signal recognition particle subunit SRP54